MADRYQKRPFPADDGYGHGDDQHTPARTESDPLAELARLIGQTDPFANIGRTNPPAPRESYPPQPAVADEPPSPPPWMQRAARQEPPAPSYPTQSYSDQSYPDQSYQDQQQEQEQDYPEQDYPASEHPLRRYASQHAEPEPEYEAAAPYAEVDQPLDPARYDDALYGQLDGHDTQHDPAYPDDPYAYQDDYEGEPEVQKRRGGLATVMVVLALAVVGTGAAFAYRTYVGSPRSGDPPIIKADTSPTKIVPAQDTAGKQPDRLPPGDGTEKIVPREEAPVDVNANARSGPRMVFPPLNQNANPPSPSSVATNVPPPANTPNGTLPNNQPRAIKTFTVHGDQADASGVPATALPPATKPAAAARTAVAPARTPPSAANASANAPLSLSPQAAPSAPAAVAPPTRLATNAPEPIAPSTPSAGSGSYLVSVSSQKNEADAQSSYRVLQGKFPSVLGSRAPVIKRADLSGKGTVYRAMVGPFATAEEASQFCKSLVSAGGQCFIPRN